MNYQTWSKRKFWLIVAGIFLLGFILAPKGQTETIYKDREVVKEVPVAGESGQIENWKKLKDTDDEVFAVTADMMRICGQGYTDLAKGNISNFSDYTNQMDEKTEQINGLAVIRQSILKQLGY